MKLIIFIPAFNEAETIFNVIKSIPHISGFKEQEVIVLNDGSDDDTSKQALKAGAIVYSHKINKGLGSAFQSGIDKALDHGADVLVTLDADGQFPADKIVELINPILNHQADLVTGSRFLKKEYIPEYIGWVKLVGNHCIAWIISSLIGEKFSDVSCGFRAYSKEALLRINLNGRFTYTQEVLIDLAMKNMQIYEIPVKVKYFKNRKSRIFKNGIHYAFKSFWIIFRTYRDFAPLKVFGFIGTIIFLMGLAFDLLLLRHYLIFKVFSPYVFAGFIGAFLNILGLGFIILGVVTDMLVKIRMNQEQILYQLKRQIVRT